MDKQLLQRYFSQQRPPSWDCPNCDRGVLKSIEKFTVKSNSETANNGGEEWWDVEYCKYVFSGMLICTTCQEAVSIAGDGFADREQYDDGSWGYETYLVPTYFNPPLNIVKLTVSDEVPEEIIRLLSKASELFWCDADSAINRLRSLVEIILDERGIPRKNKSNRLPLHHRILLVADAELLDVRDALLAVKYIGNDSSHGFSGVGRNDLITAFSIVKFCLERLYPPVAVQSDIAKVIAGINANKGFVKKDL